jgi:hypothetical protein
VAGPWLTAALILIGALATNPVDIEGCHGDVGLFMVTVILRIIPVCSSFVVFRACINHALLLLY